MITFMVKPGLLVRTVSIFKYYATGCTHIYTKQFKRKNGMRPLINYPMTKIYKRRILNTLEVNLTKDVENICNENYKTFKKRRQ